MFHHFIALFIDSAPWLCLGLLISALLKACVSMDWFNNQLGKPGIISVLKAAFLGAPLPLCSCGVIPVAMGLRRSGASRSATAAFLISTPETGIDSVSVSYVFLGPIMAIIRPIAAIISAIFAGLLVNITEEKKTDPQSSQALSTAKTSCCQAKQSHTLPFRSRLNSGIHFATSTLIDDFTLPLLIGLFFAALVQTYVANDYMLQWGSGLLSMLILSVLSIPMYICATASTPVAAGLLLSGISPGAVLVFMLVGPATNIATITIVYQELGRRTLVSYLAAVILVALGCGQLLDTLISRFDLVVSPRLGADHHLFPMWIHIIIACLLALLMLRSLYNKFTSQSRPSDK